MKTALFVNFTDREFIGYCDGKGKKFLPGQSLYMPDYLAKHFAKHLVNRELLRTDSNGNYIHPGGDKMTSPKFPEQAPVFMELFNKAYIPDETEEMGAQKDDIDALINAANKNRANGAKTSMPTDVPKEKSDRDIERQANEKPDPSKPQIIVPPDFDEDEESFEGKPVETSPTN